MIACLTGEIIEKLNSTLILEVAGVGYEVQVAVSDFDSVKLNQNLRIYTYDHLRENAHDLFGFLSKDSKRLFEQLLSVTGVGPKMALSILSIGTADEIRSAIAGGNLKFIQRASGVGKRVAERLVVDLKNKVGLAGVDLANTDLLVSENAHLGDEAAEALVSLGYSPQDAARALASVPLSLSTEDRIKQALRAK